MKKFLAILLVVAMSISMVACGGKTTAEFDITCLPLNETVSGVQGIIGGRLHEENAVFSSETYYSYSKIKYCDLEWSLYVYLDDETDTTDEYEYRAYDGISEDAALKVKDSLSEALSATPVRYEEYDPNLPFSYKWDVSSSSEGKYDTVTLQYYTDNSEIRVMLDNTHIPKTRVLPDEEPVITLSEEEAESTVVSFFESDKGVRDFKENLLEGGSWKTIDKLDVITIERNSSEDVYKFNWEVDGNTYYYGFTLKGNMTYTTDDGTETSCDYECGVSITNEKNIYYAPIKLK